MLATALLPCLLAILHPSIFYPLVNFVLRKLKRPLIENRITGTRMAFLLARAIAGQIWLGLALWVATAPMLQIRFVDVWMLSGAYCLAWSAGFCMGFMAPGGIGIREAVLSGTLYLLIPTEMTVQLDSKAKLALVTAIVLMLRLWATAGELIFAAVAYRWDIQGARASLQSTPAECQSLKAQANSAAEV